MTLRRREFGFMIFGQKITLTHFKGLVSKGRRDGGCRNVLVYQKGLKHSLFARSDISSTDFPKGESYTEGIPTAIDYQCDIPVSSGPVPQTEIEIFCNDDPEPPIHCTSRTTCIATLALNLDKIPMSTKNAAGVTRIGNHRYFCLTGAIEASYGSAMITYKVKLGGESAEFRD